MQQRNLGLVPTRQSVLQPPRDLRGECGFRPALCQFDGPSRPARDGPRNEPFRPSEVSESAGVRIDRVEFGQRSGQQVAQGASKVFPGLQFGEIVAPHRSALAILEDLEGRAEHIRILAQDQAVRCERKRRRQGGEHAMFARHVMGAGR